MEKIRKPKPSKAKKPEPAAEDKIKPAWLKKVKDEKSAPKPAEKPMSETKPVGLGAQKPAKTARPFGTARPMQKPAGTARPMQKPFFPRAGKQTQAEKPLPAGKPVEKPKEIIIDKKVDQDIEEKFKRLVDELKKSRRFQASPGSMPGETDLKAELPVEKPAMKSSFAAKKKPVSAFKKPLPEKKPFAPVKKPLPGKKPAIGAGESLPIPKPVAKKPDAGGVKPAGIGLAKPAPEKPVSGKPVVSPTGKPEGKKSRFSFLKKKKPEKKKKESEPDSGQDAPSWLKRDE